ncbi:hypothetical protein D9M71_91370 [compost metagenome]
MEGAGERRLVTFADSRQCGATMLARIDQRIELALAIAGDDQWLTSGTHGHEIVVIGDLAFVACVDPVFFEDEFHLKIEQSGLREHISGDTVDALDRAEIQAAFNKLLPLVHASCSAHQGLLLESLALTRLKRRQRAPSIRFAGRSYPSASPSHYCGLASRALDNLGGLTG